MYLINFSPVSHFYTPWKRQKTFGFLTFSEGIEMWQWTKMRQSRHFYSCTYSSLKTLPQVIIITSKAELNYSFPKAAFFRKSVSLNSRKEWGKPMIFFIRIQSENMKMTWNIRLFVFCMICNFFKCDGFTVL